jgi:hypothetical protein
MTFQKYWLVKWREVSEVNDKVDFGHFCKRKARQECTLILQGLKLRDPLRNLCDLLYA